MLVCPGTFKETQQYKKKSTSLSLLIIKFSQILPAVRIHYTFYKERKVANRMVECDATEPSLQKLNFVLQHLKGGVPADLLVEDGQELLLRCVMVTHHRMVLSYNLFL